MYQLELRSADHLYRTLEFGWVGRIKKKRNKLYKILKHYFIINLLFQPHIMSTLPETKMPEMEDAISTAGSSSSDSSEISKSELGSTGTDCI
jgi:hypothetical protein